MATPAEARALEGRAAAAHRLLHVCIGAGQICFDGPLEETGRGLRVIYDAQADEELPDWMTELLQQLD